MVDAGRFQTKQLKVCGGSLCLAVDRGTADKMMIMMLMNHGRYLSLAFKYE